MSDFKTSLDLFSKQYQQNIDQSYRKNNGIYYTDIRLSDYLIDEMFEFYPELKTKAILGKTFFEPCVGSGMFVFSFLNKAKNYLAKEDMIRLLSNIFVAEIDSKALELFVNNLKLFYDSVVGADIDIESYKKTNTSLHLLFSQRNEKFSFYNLDQSFPNNPNIKFDIIITNPPYKNLKAEKDKGESTASYEAERVYYENISLFAKNHFNFSNSGVLNIYKLFVEEIVSIYSSKDAIIGLLIPSTILTDKSCEGLRYLCFEKSKCVSINVIQESNSLFDGIQAMSSLLFKKGNKTSELRIDTNFEINANHNYQIIDYSKRLESEDNSIIVLSKNDEILLAKINSMDKLKSLSFIKNKRGELDLTMFKSYIQKESTQFRLLRGRDLALFHIKDNNLDFVDPSFLDKTIKGIDSQIDRIACQQISNMAKEKRLIFSFIPKNYILGNSCNYLLCYKNDFGIDIFYLLGLMNSSIMNWFFKLKSSNNHINNYEIDEFPIPLKPASIIAEISKLTQEHYNDSNYYNLVPKIDELVNKLFDIKFSSKKKSSERTTYMKDKLLCRFKDGFKELTGSVLNDQIANELINNDFDKNRIPLLISIPKDPFISKCCFALIEKYYRINKYNLLNHQGFKLSALDLEMIRCVPQGGSWKDIKPEVVQKSKRLVRITQTGGRTTLYGRIDYSQPSYTITTYFNRPGNGTYVHPIHDRVITAREAARFQSFLDDYFFVGSKCDYLDQIGNAVPPLLAKAIAETIKSKIDIKTSLDLFVGAGGLTSGFEQAGIKSICGVDFIENACATLKVNYPHINVICGDLTLGETKNKIYETIDKSKKRVDIICGGPPCQGFSMAGKRFVDDPRNKLFKEYLNILLHIKPKVFVMENVDGMKTMQGGKVYQEIISEFSNAGYKVHGQFLIASDYGVPQKRKRLIIIGTRNDINIDPATLYPQKFDYVVTAKEAIGDLENILCEKDATYDESVQQSAYVKMLRRNMK